MNVNELKKSEGGAILPIKVKDSFKWDTGKEKTFTIKAGTPVLYDEIKDQFTVDYKHCGDYELSKILEKNTCVVDKNNVYQPKNFRSITVIPKYVMKGEDGFEYSPYGAKRNPSDKLVTTDKYTWEIIDADGSFRVGLGRKPADSLEEAIKVAKDLEKNGQYYYMGVRKDKNMIKSQTKVKADTDELPVESKDTLPGVNDVVTKVDDELIPGKIVIEFESGKAVTVDVTQPEPITESTPKELTDKELEAVEPMSSDEPVVTAGAIVLAADEEKFNVAFLERMVKALKTEINTARRKNILKMINDTVKKLEKVQGSVETITSAYSGEVRNKQEALDLLNAVASFLKLQNADSKVRNLLAEIGIALKKMPVKL